MPKGSDSRIYPADTQQQRPAGTKEQQEPCGTSADVGQNCSRGEPRTPKPAGVTQLYLTGASAAAAGGTRRADTVGRADTAGGAQTAGSAAGADCCCCCWCWVSRPAQHISRPTHCSRPAAVVEVTALMGGQVQSVTQHRSHVYDRQGHTTRLILTQAELHSTQTDRIQPNPANRVRSEALTYLSGASSALESILDQTTYMSVYWYSTVSFQI